MTIKYIYLDDQEPEAIDSYIQEVESKAKGLHIEHQPPKPFEKQFAILRQSDFDGLILDLRLDQFPDWQEGEAAVKVFYRATTLAQEIRTRATEGLLKDYPIVLWSTDKKLQKSFYNDDTGHDLFDFKFLKEEIEDRADQIASKLVSLGEGYKQITEIRAGKRGRGSQLYKFIGFETEPVFLDPRILTYFDNKEGAVPIHEYARFILRDLLKVPGPLINEQILAARLGLDISQSDDFYKLTKKYLESAQYNGPFNSGWSRWWASLVEDWWLSLEGIPGPLRSTKADDRTEFLKKRTRLKSLVSAKPIKEGYSNRFWTICQGTEKPLDPRDGFIIDRHPSQPWQEKLYISLEAYLEGLVDEKGFKIDPLEQEKLKRAKARVANK